MPCIVVLDIDHSVRIGQGWHLGLAGWVGLAASSERSARSVSVASSCCGTSR